MNWWSSHQLKSKKPEARIAAVQKLASSQKPEVIATLGEMVSDTDPGVRQAVAAALGTFKDEKVVMPLSMLLRDFAPETRIAAA
ncbi:MAG TPA: hypothetical protein DCM86_00995, partial [Verrucomicrobiales bacterium]|nr:hypothetical protein [Verrucomicrobiales bacterium]